MKQLFTFFLSLLVFIPLQGQISTYPYLEDFESGPAGWTSGGVNSSWTLAKPAMSVINSASSGDSCWVTGTGGTVLTSYNNSENSFVLSPNFNFTSLALPAMRMKIWWDSEFSWDGAVLQSSTDNGVSWSNVGDFGDPNNWYNDNTINGNPGGNQPAGAEVGWTGGLASFPPNGSGGWVTAEHLLTGLAGQASVDLRVAFGSDGAVNNFDGFAFDDVEIFESPPIDGNMVSFDGPDSDCALKAIEPITVTVGNLGSLPLDSITFVYSINGGTPVSELDLTNVIAPGGTASYTFNTFGNFSVPGTYNIDVWIVVAGDTVQSNDTLSAVVESIPVISGYPYFQDFESGTGGWTSGGTNATWALGDPMKNTIMGASSGTNAWVTGGLGTGQYNGDEQSWVLSPCFDFTPLTNPQVRMAAWWNSEFSWDGAVLQATVDSGLSWTNVGTFGDPDNWYNDNTINGNPGGNQPAGQEIGWTGRTATGNGSGGWVTAKNALAGLAGEPDVRLRIAFGSDGGGNDDGFAFDDFEVFDPPPFDAGVADIFTPVSGCGLGIDTIRVEVCNEGTDTLTSVQVAYAIDGGTPVIETYTDTVFPDSCITYQFVAPGDFSTAGSTYSLSSWTQGIIGDPNPFNDTTTITLVNQAPIAVFPYFQNFDGPGWVPDNINFAPGVPIIALPDGWENDQDENSNPPQDWAIRSVAGGSGNGPDFDHTTGSTNYLLVEDSAPFDNDSVNLLTPCFDLGAMNAPQLTFWYHSNNSSPGASDNELHLDILYQGQWTLDIMPVIGHTSNTWEEAEVDLSAYLGVVGLRFRGNNNNGTFTHDIAIDDFLITDLIPQDGGVASIVSPVSGCGLQALDSIVVEIENFGTDTLFPGFSAAFSLDGAAPVTAVVNDTIAPDSVLLFTFPTSVNLSTPSTFYTIDAWTLGIVGDTQPGNDSTLGYTVLHRPAITTFPYIEDFETNPGIIPVEWENDPNDGQQDWDFITGPSPASGIWGTGPAGDHTTGNGFYAVVSDVFLDNDSVILVTPCYDISALTNGAIFSFWYHSNEANGAINPADENELHVDMYYNGDIIYDIILPIVHKNNNWNQAEVNLAAYPGIVGFRFRVNNNNGVTSHEIAIDDIQLQELLPQDAGVTEITSLSSECGLTATEPFDVDIRNFGTDTIFSVDVLYTINGGTPTTVTINDTIPPMSILSFNIGTLNLSVPDDYLITAYTVLTGDTNNLLDSTSVFIVSIPTVATFPYFEDFESGTGGWYVEDDNGASTWELGAPAGTVINSALSGTNAWVTGLATDYNDNDNSAVVGPCFDFSTLNLPIIELGIWHDSEFSWDGAVIQSSTDSGATWINVGALGDPNNWYNDGTIGGLPGGSSEGWTGDFGNGSGGWLVAENSMPALAGEPDVSLRIAFGSDGSVSGSNGFAFDNVRIRDTPANDMGVSAQNSPAGFDCGDSTASVEVTLINYGTAPQSNVPVIVNIGGAGSGTLTGTFAGPIQPGDTVTFIVGTVNTIAGGIFNFTSYTNLTGDGLADNDTTNFVSEISVVPDEPIVVDASSCLADSLVLTASTPVGNIFWYDSLTGGSLLATGDTFVTPFITGSQTYFAQARNDVPNPVRVTEVELGGPDYLEIMNAGSSPVDVTGWTVAIGEDNLGLNNAATTQWNMTGVMQAGEILYKEDTGTGATAWGTNILWNPGQEGWVIILDQNNSVVDFMIFNYTAADVANFAPTINGTVISLGSQWTGAGVSSVGFSNLYRTGGADTDNAGDWLGDVATTGLKGLLNPGLAPGFLSGCVSDRVPVQATINAPPPVNLGPDAVVCAGFPIDATTPGVVSYVWSTGEVSSSIVVDLSGTYYVDVIDLNGCPGSDTINMTILPSPTVDLGLDTTVCGSILLDAGNTGATYIWQDGSMGQTLEVTQSGQYFVTTTLSGCPDTDTINVTILPAPDLDLGADLAICEPTTLDAGNPGATYLWSTGETTQSISVSVPTAVETITVTVTNPNGCVETDQIVISPGSPPVIDFPATLAACDDTTLDAGNPGATYLWSNGESTQTINVTSSGVYEVTVTDGQGCVNTASVEVSIAPAPDPTISYSNAGFTYTFTTETTPGATYTWDFGDGSAPSTDQNPVYTFLFAGTYVITLTVTNDCGTETITETIGNVSLEDELFGSLIEIYPNPNDGKFFVAGEEVMAQELTIEVSDARGRIVFTHYEERVSGFRQAIDISDEAEGVYVVKVTDGQRTAITRIVKE